MSSRKHQTTSGTALNGYGNLLGEIKERIRSAQYQALRAVNKELIGLYWDIGRMIVERQKGEKWGKAVVEKPQRIVGEIGWSHNLVIMQRCKDILYRLDRTYQKKINHV